MKITLTRDDGGTEDITPLVELAHDVAIGSLHYIDQAEADGLLRLSLACGYLDSRAKLTDQWRQRLLKGKSGSALSALCRSRGVNDWRLIEPTEEELDAFLAELKAGGSDAHPLPSAH